MEQRGQKIFTILIIFLSVFALNQNGYGADDTNHDNANEKIPQVYSDMGLSFEEPITAERIIIDDFDDGTFSNRLDGACGAWNLDQDESNTYCRPEIVDVPAPDLSKKVLRLAYDIDAPYNVQNGYWMKLGNLDATGYDRLEFLVRGDEKAGFTDSFIIEIKQFKDEKKGEKLVASFRVTGITSRWQRISIPLSKFNAIREWNNLDELVIIFNNRLCSQREGVMYFDQFVLRNTGCTGPTAFDPRNSTIRKTKGKYNELEWAKWLTQSLYGYPKALYVKKDFPEKDTDLLMEIARDTWRYFDEVVDKKTHLPLDHICLGTENVFSDGASVGDYTNVTNIGLYFMCLIAGYDFGFISKEEAIERVKKTLVTVESCETYDYFLYNYYDTTTGERTSNFISLVDSGWLACGLYVVRSAFPEDADLVERCTTLIDKWDFSFFYDDVAQQFYHGYYENIDSYANYHYGTFYSESRIVSYLAIAQHDVPLVHWYHLHRTLPKEYDWQQKPPQNRITKSIRDISFYGGYYEQDSIKYVPSWGGSLFEALMPTLLLKEKEISPESLGLNNKNHIDFHISYAKDNLGYPVWGMSPTSVPGGGYSEFGVPFLGLRGYPAGVITPHVSFLSLEYEPDEAIANIRTLLKEFNLYGEYGFYDAVNPKTGRVALKYLCLDQAMILISLDNYLHKGIMRDRFHSNPTIQKAEYLLTEEKLFE